MVSMVNLQPLAKTPEGLATYLDLNLRRLADAIATLGRVEQTTVAITGTVTIDSGIPIVHNVIACLESAPVANACFVRAQLDPSNTRNVIITVYTNAFAVSGILANVSVVIIGDEPPNTPTRDN